MAFSDWSTTDSENDTASGVNIAEGCPAANVNNWGRRIMAQLRAAFNPILDAFFASTTLAQARTALGVPEGSTSMTAFGGLTNTANSIPYMTGSDAWALATLTSFARTLIDDGDAATARTTLGAIGVSASSVSSSSGYITFTLSGTTLLTLQWKDVTVASGTGSTAMTFPIAFSSWARPWLEGTNDEAGDSSAYVQRSTITTSGCTLSNAASASQTVTVFAIGV